MVGILCEKPSAARNFAAALGGMTGTYNGEKYVITAARGHLYEFKDPSEQVSSNLASQYKSWDLRNLPWNEKDFKWGYDTKDGAGATLKSIKQTLSGCEEVCISTDLDPSGEGFLLAAEILLELNIRPKKFSRMYFTDEAAVSIQKAFKSRKMVPDLTKNSEYLMAFYRSRWDLLSMQWTRISKAVSDGQSIIRQGRLKSAMVKIVGDGLKALADYKPIPFFQNKFKDENGIVYTNKDEPTFDTKDKVPRQYSASSVIKDKTEMKHTVPPKLLDLASLSSRLASRGYKAKDVLDVYQKMYEASDGKNGGYTSYPRTEDRVVTPEQFSDLLPKVDAIAKVVGVDVKLLTHKTARSTHVKTGGAHGANRPGLRVPQSLDELEKQFGKLGVEIYATLAKNYLAMLAEDYEYESQKGHVEKYPKFIGTAQVPKKMGWKLVFDEEAEPSEDENAKGIGTHAEPFVYEGVNPKPPTPTMKWLMQQLEKRNVGTGATRTSTYSDVTNDKAKYPLLKDTRGKITMTQFGEMSYQLLPGTHIGSLDLTEKVMADMKLIAEGKKKPEDGLHEIQQLIVEDMAVMKTNGNAMRAAMGVSMASAEPREKYEGVFNGKTVSFNRVYSGYRFSDDECKRLCNGEDIVIKNVQGKNGTYNAKGNLQLQNYKGKSFWGFKPIEYVNDDGSSKASISNSNSGDYATGKWKGKDVKFKRTWSGHTFTDDEVALLLAGKEISFEAVSTRTGSTYTAKGKLANQTYQGSKFVGFKPDFS